MKADWSKILIGAMVLFMIFIVTMAIIMATSNQTLYETDYYEQGEMHAERMELEEVGKNVNVTFSSSDNSLIVTFDSVGYVTKLKLINLANGNLDRQLSIPLKGKESGATISLGDMNEGLWMMELEGEVNSKPFFVKQQFVK